MKWPIPRGRISHSVVQEVIDFIKLFPSNLNNQPIIDVYERELCKLFNTECVKILPFARTAFYAVLKSLNLPPGSPILMPPITIKPFLDIALHWKLKPIFVDLDVKTGVWDVHQLENAMGEKPKIALLTYLFGVVPDLDRILGILENHEVIVIEDFSHSFDSSFNGKKIGTFGDFGICSTSSTKSFDTYGGAVLIINNNHFAESIRNFLKTLDEPRKKFLFRKITRNLILNIATNRLVFGALTFPIVKVLNRKSELEVGKFTGSRSNSPEVDLPKQWFERFTSFQAKIGIRELKNQSNKNQKRREIAEKYTSKLQLTGPRGTGLSYSTYWQYVAIKNNPIKFRNFLNANGIDCCTTSLVHIADLPNYGINEHLDATKKIYNQGVYLPCYHQLSQKQIDRVIEIVSSYHEE